MGGFMSSKKEYQKMLIQVLNCAELNQSSLEEDTQTILEEAQFLLIEDGVDVEVDFENEDDELGEERWDS
jgi:hypothetical protein